MIIDDALLRRALAEDLGLAGDITTSSLIPADAMASAELNARKPGVLCGTHIAARVFALLSPQIKYTRQAEDGATLQPNTPIATVQGPARDLLMGERVALNFLTHLSGIATLTRSYVQKISGTKAHIACTRKTHAGLRALEKYAVRCGGGMNHRFGLFDAILIKDNHVAAVGSVGEAVRRARAAQGHLVKIEVEIDRLDQLAEALAAGPDIIMLDNFSLADMREAVARVKERVKLEASGGVNLETVRAIAETGVDIISVGALTHSAPALDIGFDFKS